MNTDAAAEPLRGLGIVVTRPLPEGERVARAIEAAGGNAILFPALEILDLEEPAALLALIDRLRDFDLAIFISRNAVEKGLAWIHARDVPTDHLAVAAVGESTAQALRGAGFRSVIAPVSGFDSEALLEVEALRQVAGKRIVIFRGVGGRETLREELTRRGALVEYAQCYRRGVPRADPGPLLERWRRGEVHAVNVMSAETLENFLGLIGPQGAELLKHAVLLVPHERVAARARAKGYRKLEICGVSDVDLIAALKRGLPH